MPPRTFQSRTAFFVNTPVRRLMICPIILGINIWASEASNVSKIAAKKIHLNEAKFLNSLNSVPLASFALPDVKRPETRPAPPTPLETPGSPSSFLSPLCLGSVLI